MTRTECYMILNSVRQVGPVRVRRMIEALGSVESIFNSNISTLASVEGISRDIASAILDWDKKWSLDAEWEAVKELNATVVDCESSEYPERLKEIYDPPLVLYVQGDLEAARRKSIAIVGSRHTTSYGFEAARKLAYQCAYAGLTVTSGLARGIDTAAHQGALAAKGRTVAVLGSSLDKLFPEENRVIAEKMVETGGAVLAEYCTRTPPDKYTFPMRNRIVSGLSEGVLVVEAGKDSGALITARVAGEQGKQVFAVPGRIDNPHAQGCHSLIKDGAKLVEGVEDILAEFELLFPTKEIEAERKMPVDLSEEEQRVLGALGNDEMHLDVIIRKSGLPSAIVSSSLLRLELKKLVRQQPGRFYVKTF